LISIPCIPGAGCLNELGIWIT